MRIVTNHSSKTSQALTTAACRLGHDLRTMADFESSDELLAFDPEGGLIFMYGWPEAAESCLQFLKTFGVPVATWQVDDPHYLRSKELREITTRIARASDLYFSHTLELAQDYEALGVRVRYLATGARSLPGIEDLVAPPLLDSEQELDFALVCTLSEKRGRFFERLERFLPNLHGRLVTNVSQEEAFRVYRTTRVNVFIGAHSEGRGEPPDSWGLSERSWEVPFVGGFLLQEDRKHLRDHFEPGQDAAVYTDLEDCARQIAHYCEDPAQRLAIARRAQETVFARNLMEHRLATVVDALSGVGRPTLA